MCHHPLTWLLGFVFLSLFDWVQLAGRNPDDGFGVVGELDGIGTASWILSAVQKRTGIFEVALLGGRGAS